MLARDGTAASGWYRVVDAFGRSAAVYCDMDTTVGGWDVLMAAPEAGANSNTSLLGDHDAVYVDDAEFGLGRVQSVVHANKPSATLLFRRSSSEHLAVRPTEPVLTSGVASGDAADVVRRCTAEAPDGSVAECTLAASTQHGGQVAVLAGRSSFDRAVAASRLLNSGCQGHLLYQTDNETATATAFASSAPLGTWTATTPDTCADASDMAVAPAMRVQVRSAAAGVWLPLVRAGWYAARAPKRLFSAATTGYHALAARFMFRDGWFGCGGHDVDPSTSADPRPSLWDACATDSTPGSPGFSLTLSSNNKNVIAAPSALALDPKCSLVAAGALRGSVQCSDVDIPVLGGEVFTLQPTQVSDSGAQGRVAFDIDVFARHTCPPLHPPTPGATVKVQSRARWVRVLADAWYSGSGETSFSPTLPVDGAASWRVGAVKAVWLSGFISCGGGVSDTSYAWNACGETHSVTGQRSVFFELKHNGDHVVKMDGYDTAPTCTAPDPSVAHTGDIYCETSFSLAATDVLTPTWSDAVDASGDNKGELRLDLWAWMWPDSDAVADEAPAPVVSQGEESGRWVLLLSHGTISGVGPNVEEHPARLPAPEVHVSKVKAVYRSGSLTCDTGVANDEDYPWATCATVHTASGGGLWYAFELLRNGEFLVEQPAFNEVATNCSGPSGHQNMTGDIICDVDVTLREGDVLTPTWYEPSHSTGVSNNNGTLVVDVWAFVRDVDAPAATQATELGLVRGGDVATITCPPGTTLVGDMSRTCRHDGSWSGQQPACLRT